MERIEEKKNIKNTNEGEGQNEQEKTKTLGEKIAEGRKNKHLSQEKFAEKMGCTRQMVSRWELNSAVPRTTTMKKISSVLNIPIEELIGDNKSNQENQDGNPVAKSFNYKAVLKYVLITAVVLVALYLLYAGYKLLVLNGISSKVAQYKELDNYHFKKESFIDGNLNEITEVWYKDGLYKIENTVIFNNISNPSVTYVDVNEGYMYIVDEQTKSYNKVKIFGTENYKNGSYMYSLFPSIILRDEKQFKKLIFENNFILSYYKDDHLELKINNELIEFNKDTLLPTVHSLVMKENNNTQENYELFEIELKTTADKDVKISNEYKSIN